jgi:uncharacterized membrane protein
MDNIYYWIGHRYDYYVYVDKKKMSELQLWIGLGTLIMTVAGVFFMFKKYGVW